jgi:hypothetical protein
MPTGYTCVIDDDPACTFKKYALKCIRAFGAAAHMREDSLGKEYVPRVPSISYHDEALEELEAWKLTVEAPGKPDELKKVYEEQYKSAFDRWRKNEEERVELNARYDKMAIEVEAWEPPTREHKGFKAFMSSRLKDGRRYSRDPYPPPEKEPFEVWVWEEKTRIARDIQYHTEERLKEIERCKEANAWVEKLIASL